MTYVYRQSITSYKRGGEGSFAQANIRQGEVVTGDSKTMSLPEINIPGEKSAVGVGRGNCTVNEFCNY